MSEIEVYQFPITGQQIRTILVHGAPWFVLGDVAIVLGYRDAYNAGRLLDADEKGTHPVSTPGGPQDVTVISESALYVLIMRSGRADAKEFRRWVTGDVLPAIRKTGRYVGEVSRKELARMVIEAEEARELAVEQRDEARAQLACVAPKAEAFEAFMDADGTYSMEQVAKMLHGETGFGRNVLFRRLRELNVLQDSNLPYQRYAQHFHVVASSFEHSDGRRQVTYTTRVRASGVAFIRTKLGLRQGTLVTPAQF